MSMIFQNGSHTRQMPMPNMMRPGGDLSFQGGAGNRLPRAPSPDASRFGPQVMDGPGSGFAYPGSPNLAGPGYGGDVPDPRRERKVFAGAEPRRKGSGQPPGGDMYAGGTPYFDERTGGGFPQPPAGGVQGWQPPGAAQPIQPQSQGTPYGQQGYDIPGYQVPVQDPIVAQNEWDNFQRAQSNASKGLPPKRSQMEIDREQQSAESQRIKDQRSLVQQSMPNADQATQQAIRQRMQWYGETPEQAYQNGGFASRQAQAAAANAPHPMPQNVDPGFNAMRNSPPPQANNEEFQQWKESNGYFVEPAVYNPQKSQQRDALLYDKFTQERKAGSWVPKAPLAPVYQQDRTGEARRQALLRGIPADKLKKSQAPPASQQDQRFNNWMAKDGMYAKQDSSQLRAVQQYQQDPLAALRAAGFRI